MNSTSRIEVSGFTLRAEQAVVPSPSVEIISDAPIGKYYCVPVRIANYGRFTKTVAAIRFRKAGAELFAGNIPLTITAGSRSEITVCFFAPVFGIFSDTLDILNECGERTVTTFRYRAIPDSLPPVVIRTDNSCGTEFVFDISDALPSDLGIARIELIVPGTKNCLLSTQLQSNGQLARSVVKVG